jgi:bacterioferritin-associated ferredoxin
MIVCHCNCIDHLEIEAACRRMDVGEQPFTPSEVYKELGYRPRCGNCFPHAARLIEAHCDGARAACIACPKRNPTQYRANVTEAAAVFAAADPA